MLKTRARAHVCVCVCVCIGRETFDDEFGIFLLLILPTVSRLPQVKLCVCVCMCVCVCVHVRAPVRVCVLEGRHLMMNLRTLISCVLMLVAFEHEMYAPRAHLRKGSLRPHYHCYYLFR